MYRNDVMACKIQQRRSELFSFAYEKKNDVQTQSGISTFRKKHGYSLFMNQTTDITSYQIQHYLKIYS